MYYASCACLRSLACSFLREYVKMQTQIELIRKFVERENSLLIFIIHEIMINIVIYLSLQFRCILKNTYILINNITLNLINMYIESTHARQSLHVKNVLNVTINKNLQILKKQFIKNCILIYQSKIFLKKNNNFKFYISS